MKPKNARALFEQAATGRHNPALEGIRGSYRFDVEGVSSFRVDVDNGDITVTEGAAGGDCIIQCDEQDLVRIACGQQNLLTAVLQGRVRLEGDLVLAQRFHGILPGPGSNARREEEEKEEEKKEDQQEQAAENPDARPRRRVA